MSKKEIEKVAKTSESTENQNLKKLREVFPNFVKDGQVDFNELEAFFKKEGVLAGPEKYGLNWAGKSNAFKAIKNSSTGTLIPQIQEGKNWDTTENIFIEGDNLEVLKLLQSHYREKIKMIYIDPPYNTGKDFVYKDNFTQGVSDYYEQTGQTKDGIKMTTNTEKNGRYHSDWLTMMYPRLFMAKNLLKEDGVIFISIDDNEVANLRLIMDEIFGEENFVAQFIRRTGSVRALAKNFDIRHDYVLIYGKNKTVIELNEKEKNTTDYINPDNDLGGDWSTQDFTVRGGGHLYKIPSIDFSCTFEKKWAISEEELKERMGFTKSATFQEIYKKAFYFKEKGWYIINDFVFKGEKNIINIKKYADLTSTLKNSTLYPDIGSNKSGSSIVKKLFNTEKDLFDKPKPVELLKYLSFVATNNNDIILDFFAGSGTTAHAVMDLNAEDSGNRKWICVQLPELTEDDSEAYKAGYKNIAEISRERIRRAGEKIKIDYKDKESIGNLDIGFKAFSLSSSNYRKWNDLTEESDEKELLRQSELFVENPLINDYDEKSVVYEILIKEGFDLNSYIEAPKKDQKDLPLWVVVDKGERSKKMTITFAKKVTKEAIAKTGIGETDNEIFVCLDSALDDTTKVNITRNLTVKTI